MFHECGKEIDKRKKGEGERKGRKRVEGCQGPKRQSDG